MSLANSFEEEAYGIEGAAKASFSGSRQRRKSNIPIWVACLTVIARKSKLGDADVHFDYLYSVFGVGIAPPREFTQDTSKWCKTCVEFGFAAQTWGSNKIASSRSQGVGLWKAHIARRTPNLDPTHETRFSRHEV